MADAPRPPRDPLDRFYALRQRLLDAGAVGHLARVERAITDLERATALADELLAWLEGAEPGRVVRLGRERRLRRRGRRGDGEAPH